MDKLRKVSYTEDDEIWKQGWCLMITGGHMSAVVMIVERLDGTIVEVPITDVKFNNGVVGNIK